MASSKGCLSKAALAQVEKSPSDQQEGRDAVATSMTNVTYHIDCLPVAEMPMNWYSDEFWPIVERMNVGDVIRLRKCVPTWRIPTPLVSFATHVVDDGSGDILLTLRAKLTATGVQVQF